jgi:hypothetical protein
MDDDVRIRNTAPETGIRYTTNTRPGGPQQCWDACTVYIEETKSVLLSFPSRNDGASDFVGLMSPEEAKRLGRQLIETAEKYKP